jgi:hypothetical protein
VLNIYIVHIFAKMLKPLSFYQKPKAGISEFKSHKVPDNIINWVGPNSKSSRSHATARETQTPTKSIFMLTLVTNLGYKRFSQSGRVKLAEHLYDMMNELGEGLKEGEFFQCTSIKGRSFDCEGANVEDYEFTLEIGSQKGNVHSHAKLIVDKVVHLNMDKLNSFARSGLEEYHAESGGHPYFNVKSFPSTESIIDAYMQKAQNSLTPQQFGTVGSDGSM